MFKSNSASDFDSNTSSNKAGVSETIIGPSVVVEGNFKGDGNVIIEGEVRGGIKTKQDVRVGIQATVKASIDSTNAVVAGEVIGNIKVKEKLELLASAKVSGDVIAKELKIEPGAKVNGSIKMEDESLIEKVAHKNILPEDKEKNSKRLDKK